MYDVIIIGSGPAAMTAAIYCQRFLLKTVMIAGKLWGGQLQNTTDVENFPGMGTILGPELLKRIRSHVEQLGVEILDVWATSVHHEKRPFVVGLEDGNIIQGRAIILATGANTKWLGVPNEERLRGKGVSACAPCDAFFFRGKPVAVVGGGDTAMEETHVIANVASDVVVIHRRDEFRAQAAMVERVKAKQNVRFLYNTRVIDVLGESSLTGLLLETSGIAPKQGVESFDELVASFGGHKDLEISLEENKGGFRWILPRAGVFVAIGLVPNTQFLKGVLDLDERGYIRRYEEKDDRGNILYFTKTSVPGIFTAGDVHDTRYKQAITASGFGCMAAMDAQQWLSEEG